MNNIYSLFIKVAAPRGITVIHKCAAGWAAKIKTNQNPHLFPPPTSRRIYKISGEPTTTT